MTLQNIHDLMRPELLALVLESSTATCLGLDRLDLPFVGEKVGVARPRNESILEVGDDFTPPEGWSKFVLDHINHDPDRDDLTILDDLSLVPFVE